MVLWTLRSFTEYGKSKARSWTRTVSLRTAIHFSSRYGIAVNGSQEYVHMTSIDSPAQCKIIKFKRGIHFATLNTDTFWLFIVYQIVTCNSFTLILIAREMNMQSNMWLCGCKVNIFHVLAIIAGQLGSAKWIPLFLIFYPILPGSNCSTFFSLSVITG